MAKYYMQGESFDSLAALIKRAKVETLHRWLRQCNWEWFRADTASEWRQGQEKWLEIHHLAKELGEDGERIVEYHKQIEELRQENRNDEQ